MILLIIPAVYLIWVGVLWFLQDSLVFPRAWAAARAGSLDREGTELLWVPSDEGDVPAWFFRGAGVDDDHPAGVVVLLHGNAMCIDDWFDEATALAAYGFNVLLPEYRGYGNAPGTPSQPALTQDVSAFVDLVRERGDVVGDKIVYYGRSIGSALAAQVAVQRKPAGLVLHTPPTSIARYALRYGAPPIPHQASVSNGEGAAGAWGCGDPDHRALRGHARGPKPAASLDGARATCGVS